MTPVSPGDAAVCSDCGRPRAMNAHQEAEPDFCNGPGGDCSYRTIQKLRRELAEARSQPKASTQQASAQQASELSAAERSVVAAAVAKQEHLDTYSAYANPTRRETQKESDLADALDDSVHALLALRAETKT